MKWATLALVIGLALAVGLAGGLFYTWVLDPVEYYDAAPDALYDEDKLVYLALVGDLYVYEGDLAATEARLAELGVETDGQVLADFMERYLDGGGQPEAVRNLAQLAEDLGASGGVLLVFGPLPTPSPVSTLSEMPQPQASPTLFPSATPAPHYRLIEQTAVCAEPGQAGKILVWVKDAEGNGLAGVGLVASWASGEDRSTTGLRPNLGVGYADFEMSPQIEYEVSLANLNGDIAEGLTPDLSPGLCPTSTIALDWRVIFQQIP
jgi:hypothetical protein